VRGDRRCDYLFLGHVKIGRASGAIRKGPVRRAPVRMPVDGDGTCRCHKKFKKGVAKRTSANHSVCAESGGLSRKGCGMEHLRAIVAMDEPSVPENARPANDRKGFSAHAPDSEEHAAVIRKVKIAIARANRKRLKKKRTPSREEILLKAERMFYAACPLVCSEFSEEQIKIIETHPTRTIRRK
jgi:hypothetical protein